MRIAFANRGREAHPGGDVIQLDATIAALRRKGIVADEVGWNAERLVDYDLCHMMHCQFSWSWGNYQAIRTAGIPYVLNSIYYPGLLSGITQEQLSEMVLKARLVIPFSKREGDELREAVGYFPMEPVPNGTDPSFHCTVPASEREGVLCVSARGPEDKGIPGVRAACERLGLPFTCVSGVPHEQLPAIYAKHRVFVNASDSERMSLTVGEALCAGCRVMSHEGNRGNEHYGLHHLTFREFSEETLNYVYGYGEDETRANERARELTWDYVAERLLEIYAWAAR